MRIRLAIPDRHIDAGVLDAALEATTRANEHMLASGEVPLVEHAIRDGVRWKPEPPGPEHFDLASTVAERRWGDCDDLAPWHAAGLRVTGRDPGARAVVRRSGPQRWHAVVERSTGAIDDPSRWAGMGRAGGRGARGVHGAIVPLMAPPGGGSLALRPWQGGWASRCDLPWADTEHALSALALARHPLAAAQGALAGACIVGDASGAVWPEYVARAMGVDAALCGHDVDEIQTSLLERGVSGEDIIGIAPLLMALAPTALSMAQPLISKFGGMFGGGGGGAAAPAAAAAAPAVAPAPGGGGGGGMPGIASPYGPNGPIIIRF